MNAVTLNRYNSGNDFENYRLACRIIPKHGKHVRTSNLHVRDGILHATDGKRLVIIENSTLEDGWYQIEKNQKSMILLLKVELEDTWYPEVKTFPREYTDAVVYTPYFKTNFANIWIFDLARATRANFPIDQLKDIPEGSEVWATSDETEPLIFKNGNLRGWIMPFEPSKK